MLRALVEKIEPTLGPDEGNYRREFFRVDQTQAIGSLRIALVLIVIVFAFEIFSFSAQQLTPIVFVRLAFFGLSATVIFASRNISEPAVLDRATVIWALGFALQFTALSVLRPASKVDDVAIGVMVLAYYALAWTPFVLRALPPLVLSIGYLLVLIFARKNSVFDIWPNFAVLMVLNALGMWASARLHMHRRLQFESQKHLRESLEERDALIGRLRHSNKMESMGRIVGGVAHDFNNILGTMLASVEFLLDELPAGSTPRADAETIRSSVQRGAELTQQLLAFSRQQVLEPKVVSLNELVADTQRMLMRTIGEDIAIRVSLGDHLSSVRVDPGQVQQILLNLSVNARDAMPTGGTLTIQTKNATLIEPTAMSHSVAAPGSYVLLVASDDGTGMGAATLAQIFEPFFTTKAKGRGTGLGLSTVYGIVEQSGGHIRVTSTLGHGTTFEIFLPSVSERPTVEEETREPPLPRGTETILLAEDDADLRTLTARVLSAQGYRVLEAADGVEALRVADGHSGALDLLTTDMVMPQMGGHDLATELTAKRPGLKVLYMSGYVDDDIGRGSLGPTDAFLQKPVDPKILARKVRQVLDGHLVG